MAKLKSKYYYVYRNAKTGNFMKKADFLKADPKTVYREKRLRG
jgi:hypothetical protein